MNPEQQKAWLALGLGPAYQPRMPGAVQPESSDAEQVAARAAASAEQAMIEPPVNDSIPAAIAPEQIGPEQIATLNWIDLRAEVSDCQRCALGASRHKPVFGAGVEAPTWLIVGEAPGEQEDRSGEPFVGEAGHLLDAMLAAVGASRAKNVFVLNVLKCRPPGNRDPESEEVVSCRPFLLRQLQLLNPALILTVGKFAAQTLLAVDGKIGELRGKVHHVSVGDREIPLVASYHPAYFLRRPEEKLKGWHDLCLAQSVVAAAAS